MASADREAGGGNMGGYHTPNNETNLVRLWIFFIARGLSEGHVWEMPQVAPGPPWGDPGGPVGGPRASQGGPPTDPPTKPPRCSRKPPGTKLPGASRRAARTPSRDPPREGPKGHRDPPRGLCDPSWGIPDGTNHELYLTNCADRAFPKLIQRALQGSVPTAAL